MLALIVPSRRQVKNMDVYLQPLIKYFKELWEGLRYIMYRDPSCQRGVLRCMAYVCTPHMIIQGWEFAHVNMLFDLFIFKEIVFWHI